MVSKPQTQVVVLRVPQPMLDTIHRLAQRDFITRAEVMRALMRKQLAGREVDAA